jgi:hypothetical protein
MIGEIVYVLQNVFVVRIAQTALCFEFVACELHQLHGQVHPENRRL